MGAGSGWTRWCGRDSRRGSRVSGDLIGRWLRSRNCVSIPDMRGIPVLFLLLQCAMAANPPVNFTYNAGAWCNGDCTATGIHINALAEDSAGNTYFTGFTNLAGLPTTPQV